MTRTQTYVALGLTLLAVLPLWLVEYPPLQDYPFHLARVHVLAHYDDPAYDYRETFTLSWYPAPYVLADWLMAGLGRLLGVPLAGRLVLSLYLVLFPWSLICLARTVGGEERAFVGLAGFLLVFNWHFHMGFVSYVLSLPAALFAFAWWWRSRRDPTVGRLAILALLVVAVYLLHVYTFGIVCFVLLLLALAGEKRGRSLAGTALALVPASALLAGAVVRNLSRAAGEEGPLLLLYGNLQRKVLLALGTLPSFALAWETLLAAFAVATLLGLAVVAWRGGRRPSWPWLVAAGALVVLYLVLPDHVGRVFFVSNRVPLFVLLLGIVALPVPAGAAARTWAAAILSVLAVAQVAALTVRYRDIDRGLGDYAAALAVLPADARVAFRADKASMAEGRIAPAALFGGYHYLEAPGRRIPDLEHFVGTLRTVDYRRDAGRSLSTASVGTREELEDLLGRRWIVGPGGLVVVVGREDRLVRETARAYGFDRVLAVGPVTLRRKVRPVFRQAAEDPVYATGYAQGWDHLVTFGDPGRPDDGALVPADAGELEPVFRQGWAAVYRRRPAAEAETEERGRAAA